MLTRIEMGAQCVRLVSKEVVTVVTFHLTGSVTMLLEVGRKLRDIMA